jgi:sarcosine oxidase
MLFVSACSGHGFKHSAAMGELAINTLLQRPTIIDPFVFSVNRFIKNENL